MSTHRTPAVEPLDHGGDTLRAMTRVLGRALQALAAAGRAHDASLLAAQAWAGLRESAPAEAARLTALLHGLVRTEALHQPSAMAPEAASSVPELDVRSDAPARRHERIFETFAGLTPGTSFILVNDHDPKPLYYQFAAEHGDDVEWRPLEEGPDTWRIRIGRRASAPSALPPRSAVVPIVELENLATLVLEGVRTQGTASVLVAEPEAVDAWANLQRTLRPGQVGRDEPVWLARLLLAVSDAVDASATTEGPAGLN